MKLEEFVSKLRHSKMKIIDFQNMGLDRVGDLMLAAALAVAVTSLTVAYYYAAKLDYLVSTSAHGSF